MKKLFLVFFWIVLFLPFFGKSQWYALCGYYGHYPDHYISYGNFVDAVFTSESETYNCYEYGNLPHDFWAALDYSSDTGRTSIKIMDEVNYNYGLNPMAVYSCKNQVVLYYLELWNGSGSTVKRKVGNGAFYNVGSCPKIIDFHANNSFYYYALCINYGSTYLAKYCAATPFNWQHAQWSPSDYHPKVIFFPDSINGYLAAADSLNQKCYRIYKTSNTGSSWSMVYSNQQSNIKKMYFTDSLRGYAVGDSGLVIKTIDGGTSWSDVSIFKPTNLKSVCFVNDSVGYAGGDSALIFKTMNGGSSWVQETQPHAASVKKIYFVNDTTGFALIGSTMYTNNLKLVFVPPPPKPKDQTFILFPNPTNNAFDLKVPDDLSVTGAVLSVFDNLSKEVARFNCDTSTDKILHVDLGNTAAGFYYVKLAMADNVIYVGKLVVK